MEDLLFRQSELTGKPCPKCGKKGLHVKDHAHAQGWKDATKAVCRFCHATFTKTVSH